MTLIPAACAPVAGALFGPWPSLLFPSRRGAAPARGLEKLGVIAFTKSKGALQTHLRASAAVNVEKRQLHAGASPVSSEEAEIRKRLRNWKWSLNSLAGASHVTKRRQALNAIRVDKVATLSSGFPLFYPTLSVAVNHDEGLVQSRLHHG